METDLLDLPAEPVKGQRRYLDVPAEFEVRDLPEGRVGIRGYAAVYDQIAYGEVVRAGAFDKTVAEADDVRFLVNHAGVPMARTKSGTLELSLDKKGLISYAPDVDMDNPTVVELVSAMRRGDIDQMSFAFSPMRWAEFKDEETDRWVWEILECRLWDTSVVTYPWYDQTSVELELDRALGDLRAGRELSPESRELIMARVAPLGDPGRRTEPEPEPEPTPARGITLEQLERELLLL